MTDMIGPKERARNRQLRQRRATLDKASDATHRATHPATYEYIHLDAVQIISHRTDAQAFEQAVALSMGREQYTYYLRIAQGVTVCTQST